MNWDIGPSGPEGNEQRGMAELSQSEGGRPHPNTVPGWCREEKESSGRLSAAAPSFWPGGGGGLSERGPRLRRQSLPVLRGGWGPGAIPPSPSLPADLPSSSVFDRPPGHISFLSIGCAQRSPGNGDGVPLSAIRPPSLPHSINLRWGIPFASANPPHPFWCRRS